MTAPLRITQPGGAELAVTMPASSLLSFWLVLFLLSAMLLALFGIHRSIEKLNRRMEGTVPAETEKRVMFLVLLVMSVSVFLFWSISYTSGSLVFDRESGTATVTSKMTVFFPARSMTVHLGDVDHATLDAKPNARRIRLEMRHGSDIAYPIWSDRGGQEEAVRAINSFLRARPGA